MSRYLGIVTASEAGRTPYYTNSSHLPVGYTADIFEALDIQDGLQTLYTSGTVFHAFLGEKLPDWKAAASLVRIIAEHYTLPYYTLSPTYSICKNHGYLPGEQYVCPQCGEKAEVYSRITGYYRPVQNWNTGKAEEYRARRVYEVQGLAPSEEEPKTEVKRVEHSELVEFEEVLLFTTKSCPNCGIVKKLLEGADVSYHLIDATEQPDMVNLYGVRQVPTLIVRGRTSFSSYRNGSEIQRYIEG